MVDHCPAEKLVEHYLEFIKKANLDLKYILHIGLDGPSVNLKFEKLLIEQLNKLILGIGTCPLHIVIIHFIMVYWHYHLMLTDSLLTFISFLICLLEEQITKSWNLTNIVSHYAQKHVDKMGYT